MQYSLDGETYATDLPTGIDAKEYTVYYKVVADANHNDVEAQSFTVVIAPAELTAVALAQTELTYNKQEQTAEVASVIAGDLTLTADDYDVEGNKQTNAGTYTVTVTGKGNYSGTMTAEFTIDKANVTLTEPKAKIGMLYTGKAVELVAAGEANGGELLYSLDGENYSKEIPTGVDAGEYTVYYKVVGDENHNDVEAQSITVGILPKTAENVTIKIGEAGEFEVPAISVLDGEEELVEGVDYSISYQDKDGNAVTKAQMEQDGGDYVVVVTLKGNYGGTKQQTFTVKVPTGIKTAVAIDSGDWYDMNGRKLDGKPTKKGMYVHKGRKVIIR